MVGVYFDLKIRNTTSLYLSLHNGVSSTPESQLNNDNSTNIVVSPTALAPSATGDFFITSLQHSDPASPISLLARIDGKEFSAVPKAAGHVAIRSSDLDPNMNHEVRVIAPMLDDDTGVVQLGGLWVDRGGELVWPDELEDEDEDEEDAVDKDGLVNMVDKPRLLDFSWFVNTGRHKFNPIFAEEAFLDISGGDDVQAAQPKRKLMEVITDTPGFVRPPNETSTHDTPEYLLSALQGWENQIAEMFGVDLVVTGTDGMCLVHDCVGGKGSPVGIAEAYFRR